MLSVIVDFKLFAKIAKMLEAVRLALFVFDDDIVPKADVTNLNFNVVKGDFIFLPWLRSIGNRWKLF